jgi:hypothetical protein
VPDSVPDGALGAAPGDGHDGAAGGACAVLAATMPAAAASIAFTFSRRAPTPAPRRQVWFLGKADVQKVRGNPHLAKTNYGYDDERGDYVVTNHDHIGYR